MSDRLRERSCTSTVLDIRDNLSLRTPAGALTPPGRGRLVGVDMDEDSAAEERWLAIPGFEGQYDVSDQGRVRSLDRLVLVGQHGRRRRAKGRILVPRVAPRATRIYLAVQLSGHQKAIHCLVLEAFVGPRPDRYMGCHRNDDPCDNRLDNLYWGTATENSLDTVRNGHNRNTNKECCPLGHSLIEPNLVAYFVRIGRRSCLACSRARAAQCKALRRGRKINLRIVADQRYAVIMMAKTPTHV